MTPSLRQAVKTAAQKPLMSNREADAIIRAVLEGVREPDERALKAAGDRVWDFNPDYALTTEDPKGQLEGSGEQVARSVLNAYISALLASEEG